MDTDKDGNVVGSEAWQIASLRRDIADLEKQTNWATLFIPHVETLIAKCERLEKQLEIAGSTIMAIEQAIEYARGQAIETDLQGG
jgi:hypothetical protein